MRRGPEPRNSRRSCSERGQRAAARRQAELELSGPGNWPDGRSPRRNMNDWKRAAPAPRGGTRGAGQAQAEERLRLEVARAEQERKHSANRSRRSERNRHDWRRRNRPSGSGAAGKARIEAEQAEQARRGGGRTRTSGCGKRQPSASRKAQGGATCRQGPGRERPPQTRTGGRSRAPQAGGGAQQSTVCRPNWKNRPPSAARWKSRPFSAQPSNSPTNPGSNPWMPASGPGWRRPRASVSQQKPPGGKRKRQAGAPNLYHLRPFRNTRRSAPGQGSRTASCAWPLPERRSPWLPASPWASAC